MTRTEADVVIVGGGTAGCIIAGRLALATGLRIVLLEEGADEEPALVADLASQPRVLESDLVRRYREDRGDDVSAPGATLLSGRILGGGWSVNHGAMVRPTDEDLARLESVGGPAWASDRMLTLMASLEHDADLGHLDGHGEDGPVRIARRYRPGDDVVPAVRDLLAACEASGVPFVADVNGGGETTGLCAYPYAFDGPRRLTSANRHLAAARHRPGLDVRGGARVRRILIEDGRVVGVEYVDAEDATGAVSEVRAATVVLSAGVFHSPQLLLRSGIGPAEELASAGIAPVHELPGVGAGFLDHGKVEVTFDLTAMDEDLATGDAPDFGDGLKLHLRLRSHLAGQDPDLDLGLRHPTGSGTMVLTVRLLEQRTAGSVGLDRTDPDGLPLVRSGILEHPDDVEALLDGVRQGIRLMLDPRLGGRYRLPDSVPTDDAEWRAWMGRTYGSYNHGIGTCRMGEDVDAVVGPDLQVRGLEGLRVADASVLPMLPHANTNYSAALVGEWAAADLIASAPQG